MKKPEVAANLIEYINTQIITGRYPVGSKLPSLRLLARKFQISYTSAWNCIEYLERQGKLHKSARRGIFVQSRNAVNEASPEQQLALVAPHFTSLNDTNGLFHSTLSVLEQLAAEHHYSLMVIPMPNVKILDSATVEKLNRCRGVILMKEIDGWLTAMQITVPTVGILMENNYGGQLSLVGIDPYAAAQECGLFFSCPGHQPGTSRLCKLSLLSAACKIIRNALDRGRRNRHRSLCPISRIWGRHGILRA